VPPLWNHRAMPPRPLQTPSRPVPEHRCSAVQLPDPVACLLNPRSVLPPKFPRQPQAPPWTALVRPTPTSFSPQTSPPHRCPTTTHVPHPPPVSACRNFPQPPAPPWLSVVPYFRRVGPQARWARPSRAKQAEPYCGLSPSAQCTFLFNFRILLN
jgi:hypothetical protein